MWMCMCLTNDPLSQQSSQHTNFHLVKNSSQRLTTKNLLTDEMVFNLPIDWTVPIIKHKLGTTAAILLTDWSASENAKTDKLINSRGDVDFHFDFLLSSCRLKQRKKSLSKVYQKFIKSVRLPNVSGPKAWSQKMFPKDTCTLQTVYLKVYLCVTRVHVSACVRTCFGPRNVRWYAIQPSKIFSLFLLEKVHLRCSCVSSVANTPDKKSAGKNSHSAVYLMIKYRRNVGKS